MGEDPLQGDVGERAGDVGEILAEGGDVVDDLLFAISFKIGVAELAGGEDGVGGDVAGEGAFVEGAAGEDADVVGGAGGEEVLEGVGSKMFRMTWTVSMRPVSRRERAESGW